MFLIQRKYRPLLGLDITTSSVKLIELAMAGGQYRVEAYAAEPTPQNAINEKAIVDAEAVGEAIRRAVKRAGAKSGEVAIAISGDAAITKVIQSRLAKAHKDRPFGFAVRHVPDEDVKGLTQLAGHLQDGLFITKFRKIFSRGEMNADLLIVPARYGDAEDSSEYQEQLPTSPP